MKKPEFVNNEVYHIYNRGVEKRDVFLNNQDYFRFINNLVEFNDIKPTLPSNIRYLIRNPKAITPQCLEVQLLNIDKSSKPLIEILAFCLMTNHYHLLVRQLVDNGTVKFMQKLGTGYTNYFNQKNERVGSLFQGRFKAVLISTEKHFRYMPLYIHLNPLDLIAPEWREKKLNNFNKAMDFLESYRWSSYLDYIGNKNFPLITQREYFLEVAGGLKKFKKYTNDFMATMELEEIQDLILE